MTKAQLKKVYKEEIKKIIVTLATQKPEKIILFGSLAKGEVHPESDIDICFIKNHVNPLRTKRALRELLWKKGYSWEKEPDIHVYDLQVYRDWLSRGDPFVTEIEKGKVVYARQV